MSQVPVTPRHAPGQSLNSARMTRTEKLLAELIALPSVNPAFAPADGPATSARLIHGEARVADFLATTAAKAGLEIEFQEVFPGRSNVLARLLPKNKIKQTILLAPHLDTVGAPDAQFVPRRKNGRLYGCGACDTKGSIAAMLTALCELAESKSRPLETEVVFAGLIDEEHALAGSRALVARGFKSRPRHCGGTNEVARGHGAQGQFMAGVGNPRPGGAWRHAAPGQKRGAWDGPGGGLFGD